MAGLYPDAPGHRMAYDRDGSVAAWWVVGSATPTTLGPAEMQALNNESTGALGMNPASPTSYKGAVIFPELRDIQALYIQMRYKAVGNVETSTDTTNGLDGTWTSHGTTDSFADANDTEANTNIVYKEKMRNNVVALSASGVKAVRWGFYAEGVWSFTAHIWAVHIYGTPSAAAAPDRLRFYDPAAASEVGPAYFDWGDIARGSTVTRDFRIHNPSATLTANGVTVSMEALTDTSPANTGQHEFSTDGGLSWAATATLGNLAPGATSGVITLRRNTSASAALGLWWTRLVASASSWS